MHTDLIFPHFPRKRRKVDCSCAVRMNCFASFSFRLVNTQEHQMNHTNILEELASISTRSRNERMSRILLMSEFTSEDSNKCCVQFAKGRSRQRTQKKNDRVDQKKIIKATRSSSKRRGRVNAKYRVETER